MGLGRYESPDLGLVKELKGLGEEEGEFIPSSNWREGGREGGKAGARTTRARDDVIAQGAAVAQGDAASLALSLTLPLPRITNAYRLPVHVISSHHSECMASENKLE